MASNCTENYGLCQWEATDAVLRTDFNEDNQKIDAALKSQAGSISSLSAQMANKANTGTVSSLSTTVSQKADRSELEAETSARVQADNAEKAAREAADAANMATLRSENYWVKLTSFTVNTAAHELELTFVPPSGRAFRALMLSCSFGTVGSEDVYLRVNHITDSVYKDRENDGIDHFDLCYSRPDQMTSTVQFRTMGPNSGLCISSDGYFKSYSTYYADSSFRFLQNISAADLRSIQLIASYDANFVAGSAFVVYGLLE